MSTIPSNLSRVPNQLASSVVLSNLTRSSTSLLQLQAQLASGLRINRPSDDAIGTSTVSVLDDIIERRDQRLRNLSHADSVLNNVDAALGELSSLLIEAKGIASSQIGIGSDAETRENQAKVIDAMLTEATNIANQKYQQVYLFGGSATGKAPLEGLLQGYRYVGQGQGAVTDVGLSRVVPITLSGEDAFGALSARVEGQRDLDPELTGDTRVSDLTGTRGLGVTLASINADVNGTDVTIDLSSAHKVQDLVDLLQTALAAEDPGVVVDIDPATGNRLRITPSGGGTITISDPATDATAADLGIAATFTAGSPTGGDLDARITPLTQLAALTGVTYPLGTIRLSNQGQSRDLDLSGAETVEDLINAVRGLDIGIRVEISDDADRLNFINELSGGSMSVAEVGGGSTATELGVRSYLASTLLSDFNDGRGVQIRSGSVDPISGAPDPAKDLDFRVSLKDGGTFDVDLAGSTTVQDVLDAINAAAATAGYTVGVDFEATLAADGNGIQLDDNSLPVGTTEVTRLNGSFAGEDLGLIGQTTSASLVSTDRATVAVDSVFSHLIALRDALRADDGRGITLAAERLEADISRSAEARAEVGVRSRRITDATTRAEDHQVQDLSLKSQIRDLDFTEAALRFAQLQQQLQAGLQTAAQTTQLSLLDFLR